MGTKAGAIQIDLELNNKKFDSQLNNTDRIVNSAGDKISGSLKKIGAAVIAAFSVSAIKNFGQNLVEQAAKVNASNSQFTQTFKALEGEARASISEVAKESGILETRLQGAGSQIYAFAKSSGMDSVQSLGMMKEALQIAADSAAYYDRSLEDTTESLRSFLKGNYANDAALGVSATETTRNAAANRLYGQSFMDLSEAQKQLVLLDMVKQANAASGAMGQAAREADGWENVVGNLKEAWNQLLAAVGKPILQGTITVIKKLTEWITSLAQWAKAASQALGELFGWNTDATSQTVSNTAQTANNIANSVDSQNALTQAVAKTNAEVKRGVANFDKLNIISRSESSSNNGSGNSEGISSVGNNNLPVGKIDLDTGNADNKISELKKKLQTIFAPVVAAFNKYIKPIYDKVKKKIDELREKFQDWWSKLNLEPLKKSIGFVLEQLAPLSDVLLNGIGYVFEKVLLPIGTVLMEKVLPAIIRLVGHIIGALTPVFEGIGAVLQPIWEDFLQPLIEKGGEIFQQIVEKVGPKLEEVGNKIGGALRKWSPIIKEIAKVLEPVFEWILKFLGGALGGALEAGLESIGKIFEGLGGIADIITGFAEGDLEKVSGGFEKFGEGLSELLFAPFKHIWAAISGAFEGVGVDIEGFFASIGENIGNFFSGLWENISGFFISAWKNVSSFFIGIWENITGFFGGVADWFGGIWNKVSEAWHTVIDPWIEIFKRASTWLNDTVIIPIIDFFKGLWENVSSFFQSLWDDIVGIWNGVADWFSKNIIEPVSGLFGGIWDNVSKGAEDAWKGIQNAFSGVANWFRDIFSEAWKKVQDVFSAGGRIFNNIKNGITEAFKTVVNGLIDGINTIISGTFRGLNSALSHIHNVEILGVKPFTYINPIDVPEIPKLAKGGIAKAPTLAVVGDNPGADSGNPEVIAPLNKLQGMINESKGDDIIILTKIFDLLQRIYELFVAHKNQGGNIFEFIANLNGNELFREMVRQNDMYKASHNGKSAFA